MNEIQVRALARKYSKYRLKLEELAELLGAKIVFTDMYDIGVDIDGFVVFYNDSNDTPRWLIVVNGATTETRQRYTIAHEIGHIVMKHKSYCTCSNLSICDKTQERLANVFASELLMPTTELIQCISSGMNFWQLIEFFYVSSQAMALRLKEIQREDLIPELIRREFCSDNKK